MKIPISTSQFLTVQNLAGSATFNSKPCFRKGNGFGGVYIWGFSLHRSNNDSEEYKIQEFHESNSLRDIDLHNPLKSCDDFFPYYVGKHYSDVYGRCHEHLSYLRGGNYPIYDVNFGLNNPIWNIHNNYQASSKKAKPNDGGSYPEGLLYFPEGANRYKEFYTGVSIQNQLDWMIRHFNIIFIKPNDPTNSVIDSLEKVVGTLKFKNSILYDHTITKKLSSPQEVEIEIGGKTVDSFCDLIQHLHGTMTATGYGI